MRIADIHDLMVDQLRDLYSAEKQLIQALPRMAQAAAAPELQAALGDRLALTRCHISRMEEVFRDLQVPARAKHSKGMEGLLEEGKDILTAKATPEVKDTGLIGYAQRTGHYEIASYGILAGMAMRTSNVRVAELLRLSLAEEQGMDERFTSVATGFIQAGTSAPVASGRSWDGLERRRIARYETPFGAFGIFQNS